MKCSLPFLLILFLLGHSVAKDKAAEADSLFQHARLLSSLDEAAPYHLVAIVRDKDGTVVAKLERDVMNADEWKSETQAGGYTASTIEVKGKRWHSSSAKYEPYIIEQLWSAIRPGFVLVGEVKLSRRPGIPGSAKLHCVTAQLTTSCFDDMTGLMVTREDRESSITFSDYQPFGVKRFAKNVLLTDGDGRKFSITMEVGAAPELSEATFVPSGFMQEEATECKVTKPPRIVSAPDPIYPTDEHGDVMVETHAWIATDGSVAHIEVVRAPNANFARAVVAGVSAWKFHPAMCGNTPKEQRVTIEVNMMESAKGGPWRPASQLP